MKTKTILLIAISVLLSIFLATTPAIGQENQMTEDLTQIFSPEPTPNPEILFPERISQTAADSPSVDEILSATEIITGVTPVDMALAIGIPQNDLLTASIYTSDPYGFGIGNTPLGYHFPIQGSTFAILSSGLAASADSLNVSGSLSYMLDGINNSQGNDLVQLGVELLVPSGVNCANFDFVFFSEEFPEYVGSQFNDTFTAELGGTNLIISGTQVIAPLNFAFDTLNNPISVNTVSGVIAPTDTTYDGMTALRRAQTAVTPGENALIIFSVQDLGDSVWDSAVFLDNFHWTYDLNCGGVVVPPPTPQGNLLLQMPSAVPIDTQIQPIVTVLNQSSGPANYIVNVQLRQGFGLLAEQSHQFFFTGSGTQQYTFNFGIYDPASYYIRAELIQGAELLETQVQAFSVGIDYLRLQDAANRLSDAANQELNDTEYYAAEAMTQAALTAVNETADVFIDAILGFIVTGLSGVQELAPVEVSKAVEDLTGKTQDFAFSVNLGNYNDIYAYHQGILDRDGFNEKRSSVDTAKTDLLAYAEQQTFTWNPDWQADILRYESEISNVNETYATGGIAVREDYQPPFVRWASMSDLMSQFNWFKDTVLPTVEIVSTILLIIFIIVLVVIGIIMLIPSGGTSTALLIVAVAVGKVIAAVFTTLWLWLLKSQATKFLLSTVVIMLLAFGVSFAADVRVSPEIVNRHQSAMQDLTDKVTSGGLNLSTSKLQLLSQTQMDRLDVSIAFDNPEQSSLTQVQLYRADGRLLDIVDFGIVESDQDLNTYWSLTPGKYWVVGTANGQTGREVERLDVQVNDQPITIDLDLSDNVVNMGETISAIVTLTNMDVSPIEDLQVTLQTLEGDHFRIWTTDLGPGGKTTFQHSFVSQQAGSSILRASVGELTNLLASADQPYVVGDGPAVGLYIDDAPKTLEAGQPIEWTITAVNAGNESASIPVSLQVLDESYQLLMTATENVLLSPGESNTFTLSPTPSAEPGKYKNHLYLGDKLYHMRDVIVEADGALFVLLNATPVISNVQTPFSIDINVQDEQYQPTDAGTQVTVVAPDGSVSDLSMQQTGTGMYSATYTPIITGTYSVEASVQKDQYLGASNHTYFTAGFNSQLIPSAQDQIILGHTQEITISVFNEYGFPVSGASLVISGADTFVSGKTDNTGSANLFVRTTSNEPLDLLVKKAGYANTVTSLPVEVTPDTTAPMLTFVAPLITNQATIEISGRTESSASVFVLDQIVPVSASGDFTRTVSLSEGANVITVKALDAALNTAVLTKTVSLDTLPPSINLSAPIDGFITTENAVFVNGTAVGASLILVNEQPLPVQIDGQFSGWVLLSEIGDNLLSIIAYDQAENFTSREIIVTKNAQLFLPLISH